MNEASIGWAVRGDPGRQVLPRLYEEIRSWALDPCAEPWKASRHFGWGVLVLRGMAAWMESCLGSSNTTSQDVPPTTPSVPVPPMRSTDAELAVMLASIVLGHFQGAGM